ncbi:MAG TPA: DNA polymerase domain-containing protein [Candidatus Binataceae bacterium]|nr:DNA polymerase domain-containing protein [Candidatus Binataceae bacterium]
MSHYQEISRQFYDNRLLFGDPAEPGIVAIEVASPGALEIFRRSGGALVHERRPIKLFALLADAAMLKGLRAPHELERLAGDFALRWLATFERTDALDAARRHLRKATGKSPGAPDAPYLILADPVEQYLILTGATFFIGMEFGDLRRMQLDIETYISRGFEFPSAARDGDRIIAIALRDSSGFEQVLRGDRMDERAMLEELVRIVAARDPDVIEGHNLFRFDLEYLEARARRHRVRLALGRGGGEMSARASRLQIAERTIAYRRYDIPGRSIVDTWILAQHYDIASRELEGFGLKELAQHFRIAAPERVYIDPARISEYFDHRPEELYAYAADDVRETAALAELLAPSYFVQAQIFPYSYQNVVLRGNATKIDALMMRAYLARRHSIPLPQPPSEVMGGYTEVRRCGVARRVLHCDVTSLYPSLMLHYGHAPAGDRLGVFLRMLGDLRSFRVQAKAAVRELDGAARRNLEALQQTFKILINSFYGYLGFALGHFNDFVQANAVTRRGRELIQAAVAALEAAGAQVIEVDTDGIYFVAPSGVDDETAAQELIGRIGAAMPEGARLEVDGRYPAMFSYKMKNYVLLEEDGEMTIRGSGLRSRGLERFQRRFMEAMFRLLLEGRGGDLPALHQDYHQRLARHALGIRDLMKTETLQDSPEVYRDKIGGKRRNVSAAYELALKAERPYLSGDQVSYYVTGRGPRVKVAAAARLASEYDPAHPDENVEYYQAKLVELYAKFKPYAERDGLFSPAELQAAEDESVPAQQSIFDEPTAAKVGE